MRRCVPHGQLVRWDTATECVMSRIAYEQSGQQLEPPCEFKEVPVLIVEEDGDWRINFNHQRGEKNILHGEWMDGFVAGEFALIPVPGTITPTPGLLSQ